MFLWASSLPSRDQWIGRSWVPVSGIQVVDFKAALESLVDHGACQSFGLYGSGPDAWYVCNTLGLRKPGCQIVGVGIADDDKFEVHAARSFRNCNVTMVDPTPWVVRHYKQQPPKQPNLRFVPCALAPIDGPVILRKNAYTSRDYVVPGCTLEDLGTVSPTVLKIDIEGGEWELFNASKGRAYDVWRDTGVWSIKGLNADQIMFELHDGPPAAWLGLWRMFARSGYALWKVTNPRFGGNACGPGCRYPGLTQAKRALAELYFVRK